MEGGTNELAYRDIGEDDEGEEDSREGKRTYGEDMSGR